MLFTIPDLLRNNFATPLVRWWAILYSNWVSNQIQTLKKSFGNGPFHHHCMPWISSELNGMATFLNCGIPLWNGSFVLYDKSNLINLNNLYFKWPVFLGRFTFAHWFIFGFQNFDAFILTNCTDIECKAIYNPIWAG